MRRQIFPDYVSIHKHTEMRKIVCITDLSRTEAKQGRTVRGTNFSQPHARMMVRCISPSLANKSSNCSEKMYVQNVREYRGRNSRNLSPNIVNFRIRAHFMQLDTSHPTPSDMSGALTARLIKHAGRENGRLWLGMT